MVPRQQQVRTGARARRLRRCLLNIGLELLYLGFLQITESLLSQLLSLAGMQLLEELIFLFLRLEALLQVGQHVLHVLGLIELS